MDKIISYFNGDTLAANTWADKYQLKDNNKTAIEETPEDMHRRLAKEFARIEYNYIKQELTSLSLDNKNDLSNFGQKLIQKRTHQSLEDIEDEFFFYFDKFKSIIPQGSIMANLGNKYVFGSLSNCFGIASPADSYAGILRADEELVHLMKRRGGVGINLSTLRPEGAAVSNAAKTSTGVTSFAERYSNTTREVAQEGRRGALMLLLSVKHPSIFKFVGMKDDKTKVTGANISTMLTDEFMNAVEKNEDFICKFPVDKEVPKQLGLMEYNRIYTINELELSIMKIHAVELFDLIVEMAWKNAEPGVAYIDRVLDYCPDGVYEQYKPTVCNPCAEQWFSPDETCRLIVTNFFSAVDNPFTNEATLNLERLYEVCYIQQRLGDNLVDLEVEHIDRIIAKIKRDPEPEDIKKVELNLWIRIRQKAEEGRRTGGGFTGLGDMLASLGIGYNDDYYCTNTIEKVMQTKMRAELDASIDMAILRGTFKGWDSTLEFTENGNGKNNFYEMLASEFPEQVLLMQLYGRRNVSWSTVSPTGTVSLMTQTTSGLEPLFKAYYIRRKKINPSEEGVRVDFIDQSGDMWQEFAVLHPKFRDWINTMYIVGDNLDLDIDNLSNLQIQEFFELSPWYGSEANDIDVDARIKINSIIQKYTSNSISCTINLPKNIRQNTVKDIYFKAWKAGLKGVTVYRDGSRSGVLVTETVNQVSTDTFGYINAIKRPKDLDADYHCVVYKGKKYAVVVGMLNDNPYEVFAYENPLKEERQKGIVTKVSQGIYRFESTSFNIENLQLESNYADEKLLTRWVSLMLRHGANPKYIIDQIEKSDVQVVSFSKVIARVLKSYIHDEVLAGHICSSCGEATLVREEGCIKCYSCGYSKC